MGNSGKIALLVGVIVLGLAILIFSYFRSNDSSDDNSSGQVRQMAPGVRGRPSGTPGTGQ